MSDKRIFYFISFASTTSNSNKMNLCNTIQSCEGDKFLLGEATKRIKENFKNESVAILTWTKIDDDQCKEFINYVKSNNSNYRNMDGLDN